LDDLLKEKIKEKKTNKNFEEGELYLNIEFLSFDNDIIFEEEIETGNVVSQLNEGSNGLLNSSSIPNEVEVEEDDEITNIVVVEDDFMKNQEEYDIKKSIKLFEGG
jgi:hypothetical protein